MKIRRPDWVALPTAWIEGEGLKTFRWGENGGRQTAALALLIVIAQHTDQDDGVAEITYDQMTSATGLSRAVISAALSLLTERNLIERAPELGRSARRLVGFDRSARGWGKLPAKGLYAGPSVLAFENLRFRSRVELDALKLYLLFVARRDTKTNHAHLTFEQIEERSGVDKARIRSALSLLAAMNLVHTDRVTSTLHQDRRANAYRLTYVESYKHLGSSASLDDAFDLG